MSPRRYPLAPLAEAAGCSLASLGRLVGASGSVWKQYRDHGVSELVADRYAVRLGLHPYEVWPEMGEEAIKNAFKPCASCSTPFVPSLPWAIYCQESCRRREAQRRRRQRPDVRERKREQDAAYRAEVREYRKAQARRTYQDNAEERRAQARAYYEANREAVRAKRRERYRQARGQNEDNVTGNNAHAQSPAQATNEAVSAGPDCHPECGGWVA